MIITCPSCSARYKVKDDLIQAKGKKVKCKKCDSIFVAYPDNRSELFQPRKAAKPAVEKPAPTPPAAEAPAPAENSDNAPPQATVKVDRSQLEQFLKQGQTDPGAEGQLQTSDTVKMDPKQFAQMLKNSANQAPQQQASEDPISAQATVQVDRSKINAFLQQGNQNQKMPEEPQVPDTPPSLDAPPAQEEPSTQETVQMDPSQFPAFLRNQQETPPETSEAAPPVSPPDFEEQTPEESQLPEAPQFDDFSVESQQEEPTVPPDLGSFGDENAMSQKEEPPFPSDEELNIAGEAEEEALPGIDEPLEAPEPQPKPDPVLQEPVQEPAAEAETPQLYQAEVDGTVYPKLTIESIGRWIQEGRLLEEDKIAPDDSNQYRRAVEYPEIKPFFDQFFGSQPDQATPPKKKGFFAKLFSRS